MPGRETFPIHFVANWIVYAPFVLRYFFFVSYHNRDKYFPIVLSFIEKKKCEHFEIVWMIFVSILNMLNISFFALEIDMWNEKKCK